MSKPVKDMVTRELASRYQDASNAVWIELLGVDGITTNQFRRELRAHHMRLEVIKTALFKRACPSGPVAKLAEALDGPAALLTGGESAVDVARLLAEWEPKLPKNSLRLRGALLEGEFMDEGRAKDLAKMPSRADLQARIAGMMLSPGGKLASAILSGGGNIAGCLKALIEKLEKGDAAEETPAAAN